jgi:hypothetical protein
MYCRLLKISSAVSLPANLGPKDPTERCWSMRRAGKQRLTIQSFQQGNSAENLGNVSVSCLRAGDICHKRPPEPSS